MKLYLSSYHFGARVEQLSHMFSHNRKIAVISNALDFSDDFPRLAESLQREFTDLANIDLKPERLDLRTYFGKKEQLENKLSEFAGIWMTGGNTFILRRALAYSGLDDLLQARRETDFVCSGYSAGACVVTPTLEGIHLADDPDFIPQGYNSDTIWEGLNFVPYSIAPHYRSEHPEAAVIEQSVQYFIEHEMPFVTLSDGEDIIEEIQ